MSPIGIPGGELDDSATPRGRHSPRDGSAVNKMLTL